MQYNVKTPADFMAALAKDNDWRLEKLETIRSMIHDKAPEIVEGITYKIWRAGNDLTC